MTTEAKKLVAQKFDQKARTTDVMINEKATFASLLLHPAVQEGLTLAGFERPSPIQMKAIPLGRCGCDLIVQAKSGTGKTCVFAVIALESLDLKSTCTQVVVLAPTREIAVQIWEVIKSLGSTMPKLHCYVFIGGLPLADDKQKLKKCHIAVATPGRFKQLIEMDAVNVNSVRLFVLDEADKLLEEGFQEDINWIYSSLPTNKQMLALSATYPESLAQQLRIYMRTPFMVRLNTCDPALLGISQYFVVLSFLKQSYKMREEKAKFLVKLLSSVDFQQCLVFCNSQFSAEELMDKLNLNKWPSAYICGNMPQEQRLKVMAKFRTERILILISTDLTSRGIDVENVNLVVNFDLPTDHETYLHRNGRAGRFGSFGAAVTLINENEMDDFKTIETRCQTFVPPLPDPIPVDLARRSVATSGENCVTVEQINQNHLPVQPKLEEDQEADLPSGPLPDGIRNSESPFPSKILSCAEKASEDDIHPNTSCLTSQNSNISEGLTECKNSIISGETVSDSSPSLSQRDTEVTLSDSGDVLPSSGVPKDEKELPCTTTVESREEEGGIGSVPEVSGCNGVASERVAKPSDDSSSVTVHAVRSQGSRVNIDSNNDVKALLEKPDLNWNCVTKERTRKQDVTLADLMASYRSFISRPNENAEVCKFGSNDASFVTIANEEEYSKLYDDSLYEKINELIDHSTLDYATRFPNCAKLLGNYEEVCKSPSCSEIEVDSLCHDVVGLSLPLNDETCTGSGQCTVQESLPEFTKASDFFTESNSSEDRIITSSASSKRIRYTREELVDLEKPSERVMLPPYLADMVQELNLRKGTVHRTNNGWEGPKRGSGRGKFGGRQNNPNGYRKSREVPADTNVVMPGNGSEMENIPLPASGVISTCPYSTETPSSLPPPSSKDETVPLAQKACIIPQSYRTREISNTPPNYHRLSAIPDQQQDDCTSTTMASVELSKDPLRPLDPVSDSRKIVETSISEETRTVSTSAVDALLTVSVCDNQLQKTDGLGLGFDVFDAGMKSENTNYSNDIDLPCVGACIGEECSTYSSSLFQEGISSSTAKGDVQEAVPVTLGWSESSVSGWLNSNASVSVTPQQNGWNTASSGDGFGQECIRKPAAHGKASESLTETEGVEISDFLEGRSNGLFWKPSGNRLKKSGDHIQEEDFTDRKIKSGNAKSEINECSRRSTRHTKRIRNSDRSERKLKSDASVDSDAHRNRRTDNADFQPRLENPGWTSGDAYSSYCWNSYLTHLQHVEYFRQLHEQFAEQTRLQNIAMQQASYINHMVASNRKH